MSRRYIFLLFIALFATSPAFADWMALALDGEGTWGIAVRKSSKKQAETAALNECVKAKGVKCRVVGASDQLGYVALATSKNRVQANVGDTLADAKRAALDACAAKTSTDDTCTIEWTGLNGVIREASKNAKTNDCRPRTDTLRCRSNCVNGDCVVEYENGCKMRVHVSPRYDSFSNKWTYPSPSC